MRKAVVKGFKVESEHRLQNFMVFEPASHRIAESDVLYRGQQVRETFDEVMHYLSERQTLKDQILQNRLSKMIKMLDLVQNYDQIVVTKFLDKIWRRYAHLSSLGETYLDLKTYLQVFPDAPHDQLIGTRIDEEEEIAESFHLS